MIARCFVAVNLSDSTKERLIPLLKELKELGVLTPVPKNLHITLKFLGELRPNKVQKTIHELSKINFSPFKINLEGAGAFPNKDYVKVVWAQAKSRELEILAKKINHSLKALFPIDNNFIAHLTLGRVRKKTNLFSFFKKYEHINLGFPKALSFELMQSELTRQGLKYSVLWSSLDQ